MVKSISQAYKSFSLWVQEDIKNERVVVNRKILSVVLWCLILPGFITVGLFLNRKMLFINLDRYSDALIFFPPLVFVTISLWPTMRDLPRVFKKGGLVALLEDSQREVEWRENTVTRLNKDFSFLKSEWQLIEFHLRNDLDRVREQNRYMTILAGAVLFLMFQFLDLGGSAEMPHVEGAQAMVKSWVEQFSQWSFQFFSLVLFTALFYLSGTQFQRSISRYLVCVQRILEGAKFE